MMRILRTAGPCIGWAALSLLASCSTVETRLEDLAQSPNSIVVVKDSQGTYWALPGAALKTVEETRVTLAAGQLVAYCTHAEGPPQKIAEGLVQYRDRGPTGSFGLTEMSESATKVTTTGPDGKATTRVEGEPWKISGCVAGDSIEGKEIAVAEILEIIPKP